ncbi:hypothetical protein ACFPM3_19385 [Streptomyces coeruleoprunus]|uniref:Uncharacterized protein n=1 Tax=Streptomyces coeruleoprunus TaxID=285563 RepID=A0ABV9XH17_9ACTN
MDPAVPDFRPTHVVPRAGLPAWETPGTSRPTAPLDPFLPVRLLDRAGDWGRILCSNGWSAWVDGRLLVPVPADPPSAVRDTARTADPRPLLARAEESVARYRRAVEDLAAGRTDTEGFRGRTGGLRIGMVVQGEEIWLYDAEHERWVYYDGTLLTTYAAPSPPEASAGREEPEAGASPAAGHEPTRVVGPEQGRTAGPPDTTRVVGPDATQVVGPDETQVAELPGERAGDG